MPLFPPIQEEEKKKKKADYYPLNMANYIKNSLILNHFLINDSRDHLSVITLSMQLYFLLT
jgi:hypothetical protein